MAHYNLTYACGHTGTVELFGKREYREERIQWLEGSVDCPACKKKAAELQMQNFEKEGIALTQKRLHRLVRRFNLMTLLPIC